MRVIARLNVGGPAIHVTLLTEHLGPPEFESTLVCGTIGPAEADMSYLARSRGIEPVYLPRLGRELSPIGDIVTTIRLWRLMRHERPDIVHTHTAKAGFVGRLAAWGARVPVRVHTYHGHVFQGYFGPTKTRVFLGIERTLARVSQQLITISPGLRDELVDHYRVASADRFSVIPLGLDLSTYRHVPRHLGTFRSELGVEPTAPLIGIVGRLVPIKNHALFVAAAARVHLARPDARFVVVGDGEERPALETVVAEADLRDIVIFAGWKQDLAPIYSDLDVLVISSDNEGTPVSIIEALAAGTAVVSTAVGGVPDLLEHGSYGRLTKPGDAEELASAIIASIGERDDDRTAIRDAVVAHYSIERLADDIAALYRRLLDSGAN